MTEEEHKQLDTIYKRLVYLCITGAWDYGQGVTLGGICADIQKMLEQGAKK